MAELKHELFACIDNFREDLRGLLLEAIHAQVSDALEKAKARERTLAKASNGRRRASRDNGLTLELSVRRGRGRKPEQLSLLGLQGGAATAEPRRRGRRGGVLLDPASSEPAKPPEPPKPAPLFVHKRLRTGEIKALTRNNNDAP
jgi:hypothetical protein